MNKLNLKNMSKKNKIITSCLVVLTLIVSIVGIVSYLADADSIDNIFTIGGNTVELVEEFNPPDKLEPGISFQKDVKVKNTGPNACYVRVKAVFNNSDVGQYCEVDWNTEDWTYNAEDGYWYYKEPISRWEKTASLFTTVKLADDIPVSLIKDFDMIIYGESYQSEGFDAYEDAWGNYEKNKDDQLGPSALSTLLGGFSVEAPTYVNTTKYPFTIKASDSGSGVKSVTVNGVDGVPNGDDGTWSAVIDLEEDAVNEVVALVTDNNGNVTTMTRYLRCDSIYPVLEITSTESDDSENPTVVETNELTISGNVSDSGSGVRRVLINGMDVTINEDGTWSKMITLPANKTTTITVTAIDNAGNSSSLIRYAYYKAPENYIVINNLTNVITDNEASSIQEQTSYMATLTAEEGFVIDSVSVTMGSEDITATAYADGVVNIDAVTGNVTIIAVASKLHTITYDLIDVTTNNSLTSIKDGDSYTATLTTTDGYSPSDVTITMGGVDVTSTMYADGVINIPSVTGDLNIVASMSEIILLTPNNGGEEGELSFYKMDVTAGMTIKLEYYLTKKQGYIYDGRNCGMQYYGSVSGSTYPMSDTELNTASTMTITVASNGTMTFSGFRNDTAPNGGLSGTAGDRLYGKYLKITIL